MSIVYDYNGNVLETDDHNYFWQNNNTALFWILHLDCGRKYFSVANIKSILDALSDAGGNQIQLHFSEDEGFRLALDNMTVKANDGNTYDLTPCLGGNENPTKWYTQSEMDEIIEYSQSRGIDVVPSLDMPGHMGRILSVFPQFKMNNTNTVNIKNATAVNFAKAIVDAYSKYFSSRGCKWYDVGYDEIMGVNVGFPQMYNNGEYNYVVNFANDIAYVLKKNGMIPRTFNEGVHYANSFRYWFNRDYEIYYFYKHSNAASSQTIQDLGYRIINANHGWYWVNNKPTAQVTAETLASATLLKSYHDGTLRRNSNGAMFCIWCDYKSTASDNGDNGDSVVTAVTPLIAAFGTAISNAMATL